jgi:hypothetical protein
MEAKAAAKGCVCLRHMLWICSDKGHGFKAGKRQPININLRNPTTAMLELGY